MAAARVAWIRVRRGRGVDPTATAARRRVDRTRPSVPPPADGAAAAVGGGPAAAAARGPATSTAGARAVE